MSQISARDYKKSARSPLDLLRWRQFGIGVLVGVLLTATLFSAIHRHQHAAAAGSHSAAHRAARTEPASANAVANAAANAAGSPASAGARAPAAEHYDFYQMLPHFEVVVPEKEHPLKPSAPATPVERAGVYVLQAGSYRSASEARRVVKMLSQRGIAARVQRVAVDTDVWYRVRVGPIDQLSGLNRMRRKLQTAGVDALVIRVGD